MRRTDNYAGNQVRILLDGLNNSSHSVRIKTIQAFQTYVSTYQPNIKSETISYLYTGKGGSDALPSAPTTTGLIDWCGAKSDKHNGQLKRICGPAIELVRWLVTLDADPEEGNPYYDGFVQLPLSDLQHINFPKHISLKSGTAASEGKFRLPGGGGSASSARSGSEEDAFSLLAILMEDHRSPDGKNSPIDINELLDYNQECRNKFDDWMAQAEAEELDNLKANKRMGGLDETTVDRPLTWNDLTFKCVPKQEGEEDSAEVEMQQEESAAVPDPLGIASLDLRSTQALFASGRLFRSQGAVYARRTLSTYAPVLISGSASAAQNNPSCGVITASGKRKSSKLSFEDLLSVGEDGGQGGSDDDDDDDDDDFGANGAAAGAAGSGSGGGGRRFADMDEAELDAAEQRAVELAGGDLGSPPARSSRRSSDRMSTRRRSSAVLEDSNFRVKKMKNRIVSSIVPSDKTFSPVTFLTVVHGTISFSQLRTGLDHLREQLKQQSRRRENLVRLHFGLFVQCADGLEWLKLYRKGVKKPHDGKGRGRGHRRGSSGGEDLHQQLQQEEEGEGTAGDRSSIRRAGGDRRSFDRRGNSITATNLNPFDLGAGGGRSSGTTHGSGSGAGVAGSMSGVIGVISSGGVDKGMEKLKHSQATLDAAKVEAQRTLAPILERMKQSRRIRSAEKVLRRMTGVLEYPSRMRAALERGDLAEVVATYRRVQTLPTSASLKIVLRVKEAAEEVISELKQLCLTQLLSPAQNYNTLLKCGRIWLELEGASSYAEIMRHCFIRQLLHFTDLIRTAKERFCADCADANDKGLEQSLMQRSPFLFGGGGATGATGSGNDGKNKGGGGGGGAGVGLIDGASAAVAAAARRKHAGSRGSRSGSWTGASSAGQRRGHHLQQQQQQQQRRRSTRRSVTYSDASEEVADTFNDDFGEPEIYGEDWRGEGGVFFTSQLDVGDGSSSGALELVWDDNDEDLLGDATNSARGTRSSVDEFEQDDDDDDADADDDYIDDDEIDDDYDYDVGEERDGEGRNRQQPHRRRRRSGSYTGRHHSQSQSQSQVQTQGMRNSLMLCAIVRQSFVEQLVDMFAKWFPTMFRLVTLLSGNAPSQPQQHSAHFSHPTSPAGALIKANSISGGATSGIPFLSPGMRSGTSGRSLRFDEPSAATEGGTGTGTGTAHQFVTVNRGATSPARLLGVVMRLFGECLKDVVQGLGSGFNALTLPSELLTAFAELESFSSVLDSPGSVSASAVSAISQTVSVLSCSNSLRYDSGNKAYEALAATPVLSGQLRHPFHRDALLEVFDLYNAVEQVMRKEAELTDTAVANTGTGSTVLGGAGVPGSAGIAAVDSSSPTELKGGSFNPFATSIASMNSSRNRSQQPLSHLSPGSPYYDCMHTLYLMAKESEMAICQKSMDKLMDLVYKITADLDGLPSGGGAGEAGSSSGGRSSGGGNFSPNANHHTAVSSRRRSISDIDDSYSGNGFLMGSAVAMLGDKSATRRVEHKVMEFEDLLSRFFKHISSKIIRPDWVGELVHEGIRRAVTSFVEALRREGLRLEEALSSSAALDAAAAGMPNVRGSSVLSTMRAGTEAGVGVRSRASSVTNRRNRSIFGSISSVSGLGSSGRGRRSTAGAGGGGGNGFILQSLEEELSLDASQAEQGRAVRQLDLLRACMRLRCETCPRIVQQLEAEFPLSESAELRLGRGLGGGGGNGGGAPLARKPSLLISSSKTGTVGAVAGGLVRTNSSLLNKLFSPTASQSDSSPNHGAGADQRRGVAGASPDGIAAPYGPSTNSRSAQSEQHKSLAEILKAAVDTQNINLLDSTLRSVVEVEERAAVCYVELKVRELRTTVFAGFALQQEHEIEQTKHRKYLKLHNPQHPHHQQHQHQLQSQSSGEGAFDALKPRHAHLKHIGTIDDTVLSQSRSRSIEFGGGFDSMSGKRGGGGGGGRGGGGGYDEYGATRIDESDNDVLAQIPTAEAAEGLPVHLSRVLLTLTHEKSLLLHALGNTTVQKGSLGAAEVASYLAVTHDAAVAASGSRNGKHLNHLQPQQQPQSHSEKVRGMLSTVSSDSYAGPDSVAQFNTMSLSQKGKAALRFLHGSETGKGGLLYSASDSDDGGHGSSFDEMDRYGRRRKRSITAGRGDGATSSFSPQTSSSSTTVFNGAAAAAAALMPGGMLYREYLYKEVCGGLLSIYQQLIERLSTNTLGDGVGARDDDDDDDDDVGDTRSGHIYHLPSQPTTPHSAVKRSGAGTGTGTSTAIVGSIGDNGSAGGLVGLGERQNSALDHLFDEDFSSIYAKDKTGGKYDDYDATGGIGTDEEFESENPISSSGKSSPVVFMGQSGKSASVSVHGGGGGVTIGVSGGIRGKMGRSTSLNLPSDNGARSPSPAATAAGGRGGTGGNTKSAASKVTPYAPICLGQAIEELKFLLIMLRPLLDTKQLQVSFDSASSAMPILNTAAAAGQPSSGVSHRSSSISSTSPPNSTPGNGNGSGSSKKLYTTAKILEQQAEMFSVMLSTGE